MFRKCLVDMHSISLFSAANIVIICGFSEWCNVGESQ